MSEIDKVPEVVHELARPLTDSMIPARMRVRSRTNLNR
jgi:hypothetical protein